jgi:hypothetical protein
MSLATFRQALELCSDAYQAPFLGGGEPTIHPLFEQMLLEAMGTCDEDLRVGIITNGGIKRRALILAQLTKAHVINAELSLDEYHDPIHPDVVKAFQKIGQSEWGSGFMAVRDTSNNGQREGP